ncbi:actin-like protein arp8, partial [Massospora cicadina]
MEGHYSEEEEDIERKPSRGGSHRRPTAGNRHAYQEPGEDSSYGAPSVRQPNIHDSYRQGFSRAIPPDYADYQERHTHAPADERRYRQSEISPSSTNLYPDYSHQPYFAHTPRDYYERSQPRTYSRLTEDYAHIHQPVDYNAHGHPHPEPIYGRTRERAFQGESAWGLSHPRTSSRSIPHPDSRYLHRDDDLVPQLAQPTLHEHGANKGSRYSAYAYPEASLPGASHRQPYEYYSNVKHEVATACHEENTLPPNLKIMNFTSFPLFYVPSCKSAFSGFSQVDAPRAQDTISTAKNPPFVELEDGERAELDLSKNCIVLHPGSRNIRLGLAGDPFPKELAHVIARRVRKPYEVKEADPSSFEESRLEEAIAWGEAQLLKRLQDSRRKPSQNAQSQVLEFNASVSPTPLPEHNDPYRREFATLDAGTEFWWAKRPPSCQRTLPNTPYDYRSLFEVRGDLEDLWSSLIQENVGVPIDAFEGFTIGLVIPDQFCPVYVSQAIDIFLNSLGFHSIFLIQESVSATFGAGISSACVVNVGAQTTSVACVEEGFCFPHSRIAMPYGGDDVTALLIKLLQRHSFPYEALDTRQRFGWQLAERLKWQLANMNESELSIHLSQFYVPIPGQPTLKFEIKVYDEGFIAPMLYFNPPVMDLLLPRKQEMIATSKPWITGHVLQLNDLPTVQKPYPNTSVQSFTPGNHGSTPHSLGPSVDDEDLDEDLELANLAMDLEEESAGHSLLDSAVGLDKAIAKSIHAIAGGCDRQEVVLVHFDHGGGAALIPGFADMLATTLRTSAPPGTNIEVLTSVRDLDPRDLSWKGASVYAKLDMAPETFVNFEEWGLRGLHAVKEKLLFAWPRS